MYFSFSDLNFNSVVTDNVAMLPNIENQPDFEFRATSSCFPPANVAKSVTVVSSKSTILKFSFDM